jgi:hypothetical protein
VCQNGMLPYLGAGVIQLNTVQNSCRFVAHNICLQLCKTITYVCLYGAMVICLIKSKDQKSEVFFTSIFELTASHEFQH